eukprot:1149091-Heterocapsa_arctica.AAC.1
MLAAGATTTSGSSACRRAVIRDDAAAMVGSLAVELRTSASHLAEHRGFVMTKTMAFLRMGSDTGVFSPHHS